MIAFFCIIDSGFVKGPGINFHGSDQIVRLTSSRLLQTRQITLEENRRRNTVDNSFPLPATDVGRDQEVFRRARRHPFIPGDHRD